jgi:hypothetical protein
MEKNQLPPELCNNHECKDLKLFDDKELLEEWRNNKKGIQWTDQNGNLFKGAIDNLLKKGNKLIVLDYKTRGFPLKDDTANHYQDQIDIYNLLLRKNNLETEDFAYLLFYHPDKVNENGNVVFHTDLINIKVDIKNAEKIFEDALKVLKEDMPQASEECPYCKWAGEANSL